MIVKRYIVDSMQEALAKIRYELGNDAVIVSQRKIRQKGFLGFFKPKKLEVTAAADDKNKKQDKNQPSKELEKEITELKEMVETLVKTQTDSSLAETKTSKKTAKLKIKDKLVESDVPEEIVEEIINRTRNKLSDKKVTNKKLEVEIINTLKETIKTADVDNKRIHVFVGPTGVGKTTTIAKLASIYTLYKNKKVGLITIDTYRIGAIEQLKSYAEILGVPFEVVFSIKDIPKILENMKKCDILLIDTTGRNSKNAMQIAETKQFIEKIQPDNVYLVLSMTTKQKDLKLIIENYNALGYNSLIFTKLDETEIYGGIITSSYTSGKPISYITTGQNVPEDIELADPSKLFKLVMGEE
ncbi:Flagellar biosynthesis protein FlhF [Caloramator mitchellensis]|uniref:Flagellar biosynthesis protein FlhF n=1 Tax=Caloramator mitchellensis TaxID=908809 RepID=A0A0R3K2A7_CALMK|nr:flagellar biosynthesis protein FlhF [Caloramator mitchellensis]KRQ87042.1 Flagellar biosynthesis protein FlhF [Caloramator mitchellensis]